jgi:hypothetical protein
MYVYDNLGTLLCITSRHWGPNIKTQQKLSDFLQLKSSSSSSSQMLTKDNPQHSNSASSTYTVNKSSLQASLQLYILPCCWCWYSTTFLLPPNIPRWSLNLHPKNNKAYSLVSHTTIHFNLVLDSTPNMRGLTSETHGSSSRFQSLH